MTFMNVFTKLSNCTEDLVKLLVFLQISVKVKILKLVSIKYYNKNNY